MAHDEPTRNPSDQEPAEGSRETVNATVDDPGARERFEDTDQRRPAIERQDREGSDASTGITNRPIEEELDNQRDLPPRGESKTEEKGGA